MTSSRTLLDPTFPLCWEDTETLRIGFDRAEVRLHSPSPAAQRFIDKLRSGLFPREIAEVAEKSGLTIEAQKLLLHQLDPVLMRVPAQEPESDQTDAAAATIAVFGEGGVAQGIRERISAEGFTLAQHGEVPGFAILVEQFLGTTSLSQTLLSDDVPHFPVRVTDRHLFLGPTVIRGGMPCLTCVELSCLDNEPALHILAAQLANITPAAASTPCIDLASSCALAIVRRWRQGHFDLVGVRLSYPIHQGLPVLPHCVETIAPRSDCGCVALAQ